MKKIFLFIYAFILLASIFLIVYAKNIKQSKQSNEYNKFIFEDSLIASEKIIQGKYNSNINHIVVLFLSTHCEYCTSALNSLVSNAKNIDNKYQLLLVFSESNDLINSYIRNFQTEALQNKIIYSDSARRLNQLFKVKTIPSIFVINSKKIVEAGVGSDEINQIIPELK